MINRTLLLIDDPVFLHHAIGLIMVFVDKNIDLWVGVNYELKKTHTAEKLLLSWQVEKKITVVQKHELGTKLENESYDLVICQWGPPKSFMRKKFSLHRNKLLQELAIRADRYIAIPHGFEIKVQKLQLTLKSRLRSLVTNFSFNPFEDYNRFYHRYLFDTDEHAKRYASLLDKYVVGIIGLPTFNPHAVQRLMWHLTNHAINPNPYKGRILVMPKMAHVSMEAIPKDMYCDYVVPHPREFSSQLSLISHNFPKAQVIEELDLFRIGEKTELIDFGTSLSIVGQVLGARVEFHNALRLPLNYLPNKYDSYRRSNVFSAGCNSYDEYTNHIIKMLG